MTRKSKQVVRSGFTLVEILAAVTIVAILVALLVPAVGLVTETAENLRQQAQFNGITVALEAYRNDFGDYPESYILEGPTGGANGIGVGPDYYCGAQRLAEAMVGRDAFGVHPRTQWYSDGFAALDADGLRNDRVYWNGTDYPYPAGQPGYTNEQGLEENITSRKGPYMEIDTANAVKLFDLYSPAELTAARLNGDTFVLCDSLGKVKNLNTKKRTGMPILYYKANSSKYKHDRMPPNMLTDNIYNVADNAIIGNQTVGDLQMGLTGTPLPVIAESRYTQHRIVRFGQATGQDGTSFYDMILNPKYENPARPFNPDTFILICAGQDGVYGTADDIFNFDKQ